MTNPKVNMKIQKPTRRRRYTQQSQSPILLLNRIGMWTFLSNSLALERPHRTRRIPLDGGVDQRDRRVTERKPGDTPAPQESTTFGKFHRTHRLRRRIQCRTVCTRWRGAERPGSDRRCPVTRTSAHTADEKNTKKRHDAALGGTLDAYRFRHFLLRVTYPILVFHKIQIPGVCRARSGHSLSHFDRSKS